jgi:NAD(P)-dependent dehydrogenase (short-subunit alcohol dehydrogenase family)
MNDNNKTSANKNAQTELISKRLDGKIAVITGGNSGIGFATAQQFVQEGAYVFITGRRQSELDKAAKQIGKNVTDVQGDVSNLAELDRLYETVKQQKGRIDVLFANAGIVEFAPLRSITESHFDKIISVNLKGLLFTVQKALPLFREGGSIILTASEAGSIADARKGGSEGMSVYGASKAAVRSFARSWTLELKNRKIRVNTVSPGPIATPMLSSAGTGLSEEQIEQFKKNVLNSIPLGRVGNPDEIAKAVAFLASDDSSYITGIELFVDGGAAQI